VNSGFVPFLIVFTVTLVMQLATVLLQTDNMQIAQKLLLRQRRDSEHAGSLPSLISIRWVDCFSREGFHLPSMPPS